MTRGQVMIGFSESAEYQRKTDTKIFVFVMYASMLRRAPTSTENSTWIAAITGGEARTDLIAQILASAEYALRFQP